MVSVIVAGLLEQAVNITLLEYTTLSLFFWALIEETLKYANAHIVALKTRFVDDAMDPIVYMITSALGFAAAENILFLFEPLANGQIHESILTLSARFVGATLLHIIASGLIGIAIGFAFYKSKTTQKAAILLGILSATILHTAFNSFIIKLEAEHKIWVFAVLWTGLIGVILVLEKIKNIKKIKND